MDIAPAARKQPQRDRAYSGRVRAGRVAEIAACHHERLDGKGYFRGLTGESLGLSARVVAVADVYEALTAVRPYRAAMSPEEALRVVDRSTGDHLAAEAVTALRDVL